MCAKLESDKVKCEFKNTGNRKRTEGTGLNGTNGCRVITHGEQLANVSGGPKLVRHRTHRQECQSATRRTEPGGELTRLGRGPDVVRSADVQGQLVWRESWVGHALL